MALALLFASAPPAPRALLALTLLAAPGLLALVEERALRRTAAPVLAWAVAAGGAASLTGGVAGPLAAAVLAPALAGTALRSWGAGVAASCLAAGGLSVLSVLGRLPPAPFPPADGAALASGLIAAVALLAAAAAALAGPGPPAVAGGGQGAALAQAEAEQGRLHAALDAAEAARRRAEGEAQARARFLAEMSHELRTPLNAIVGFSDIMRQRLFGPLSDRYGEYAELIHESGGHLTSLLNDVLDMSKIDADRYELRREVFDAREPAATALKLMRGQAETKGVSLSGALPAAPLEVDADPRALKQMALNLISNAIKFTPVGGAVTLSLGAAGGDLELTVSDTGVGVAPEELERLGRAYAQGEAGQGQGTGLGLSLVRAFAGLHGGALVLESRLGEGTAATVRLPVVVAPPG